MHPVFATWWACLPHLQRSLDQPPPPQLPRRQNKEVPNLFLRKCYPDPGSALPSKSATVFFKGQFELIRNRSSNEMGFSEPRNSGSKPFRKMALLQSSSTPLRLRGKNLSTQPKLSGRSCKRSKSDPKENSRTCQTLLPLLTRVRNSLRSKLSKFRPRICRESAVRSL